VFLGYYAPLEPDRDPTCDDIVRRLSNLDFFVDFGSSGLDARLGAAGHECATGYQSALGAACAEHGARS
jgi:hypothetical protein